MPNYEQIRLGFDESFLNEQLERTYRTFEEFAQGVRTRLDESVFSEASLRRMFVANERLKEYLRSLQEVQVKKQEISDQDVVHLKRIEAEEAHLRAGASREAQEYERARRSLPSTDASRRGGPGSAGMFIGSAMLAGGQGISGAVLGHEIGNIFQGISELRDAYKKRDPVTGERDDQAIGGAWGGLGSSVAKFAVTQLIAGFDIRAQQAEGYRGLFRAQGYDQGEERFRRMGDMDILKRFGMSRMETFPYLEALGRETGSTGSFENILSLQRQTGLGREGVGLLGAAARRGMAGNEQAQADYLAQAVGLAVAENLPKGRMGEILNDLQQAITGGRGSMEFDTAIRTRIAAARAGGPEYTGERGGAISRQFEAMGTQGGIGEGVAIMLQMRQGKGFIESKIAAERGYFKTQAGIGALIQYMKSNFRTRDQRILFLQQMAGGGFIDADMIDKILQQMESDGSNLQGEMDRARGKIQGFLGAEREEDIAPGEARRAMTAIQAGAGTPGLELSKVMSGFLQNFPSHPLATTGRFLGRAGAGFLNQAASMTPLSLMEPFTRGTGGLLRRLTGGGPLLEEGDLPSLNYFGSEPGGARPYHQIGTTGDVGLDMHGANIGDPTMRSALSRMAAAYYRATGKTLNLGGSVAGDRSAADQAAIRARHADDPSFPVAKHFSQHEAGRAVDIAGTRSDPELVRWLSEHAAEFGFVKPSRLVKGGRDTDPPHYEYTGGGADRPLSRSEAARRNVTVSGDDGLQINVHVDVDKSAHRRNDTSDDDNLPNKGRGIITTNNRPNGATNG